MILIHISLTKCLFLTLGLQKSIAIVYFFFKYIWSNFFLMRLRCWIEHTKTLFGIFFYYLISTFMKSVFDIIYRYFTQKSVDINIKIVHYQSVLKLQNRIFDWGPKKWFQRWKIQIATKFFFKRPPKKLPEWFGPKTIDPICTNRDLTLIEDTKTVSALITLDWRWTMETVGWTSRSSRSWLGWFENIISSWSKYH